MSEDPMKTGKGGDEDPLLESLSDLELLLLLHLLKVLSGQLLLLLTMTGGKSSELSTV